jgi:hypothetical protein
MSAPPVPTSQWQGLTHEWVAPDGRVWNLNDWESGLVLDSRGVEGLHNPVITRHTSKARLIPGHRRRGWRAEAREVFWPAFLYADRTADWLALHRAFWGSIHPDVEGRWRVTCDGETRELALTGIFDAGHVYDTDPLEDGWAQYDVTLEAAQPYWAGKTIRRGPWRAPGAQPFFPGPPHTISSSSAFGSATIPNPGDVEAHGIWWADGPLESMEFGVGSAVIVPPFPLVAGQTLRIDTDPRNPTAQLGPTPDPRPGENRPNRAAFVGEDATEALGLQEYAAVPPGASVHLHVMATGSGAIEFEIVPLYFRAF